MCNILFWALQRRLDVAVVGEWRYESVARLPSTELDLNRCRFRRQGVGTEVINESPVMRFCFPIKAFTAFQGPQNIEFVRWCLGSDLPENVLGCSNAA